MTHILFAWELGGGSGHCVNLAPLICGLAERGHEVVFAARDIHIASRVIGSAEVSLAQAPMLRSVAKASIPRPATFGQILHNVGFGDDEQLFPLVGAWRHLIQSSGAEAIVCEHAPAALLAARLLGVKRIVVGSGFVCPPNLSPFPTLVPVNREVDQASWSEQPIVDRINRLINAAGGGPIRQLSAIYADADELALLTYEELDHYKGLRDGTYWGTWSPTGGIAPQWPNAAGPRIFAYFQPAQYAWRPEPAIREIGRMECSAIIYAPHIPPETLQELHSPNLNIEHQRLDIEQIAAECDVAITHGNNGTATHFLRFGIPQLTVPLFLEQVIFARRMEELGASVSVTPGRPDLIVSKVAELIEDSRFRNAAEAFQNRYGRHTSRERAIELTGRINDVLKN